MMEMALHNCGLPPPKPVTPVQSREKPDKFQQRGIYMPLTNAPQNCHGRQRRKVWKLSGSTRAQEDTTTKVKGIQYGWIRRRALGKN